MIAKLAKAYVSLVLILGTLCLVITVFLHIRALLGIGFPIDHLGLIDFAIAFPLLGLAKERNVWANEIKALPKWVKPLTIGLLYYSIAIALFVLETRSKLSAVDGPVILSAFFCSFLSTGICIPIALLTPGYADTYQVKKRAGVSICFTTVATLFVAISQFSRAHSY